MNEQDISSNDDPINYSFRKVPRITIGIVLLLAALNFMLSAFYTVQEGFRGVERTLGEVKTVSEPGLHVKIPLIQTVDIIEIRPRKYQLVLPASTAGTTEDGSVELQMPSTVTITGNWFVDPKAVKSIVSEFGSIQQFEDRILDPRVREATLAEFPRHTIEDVMTNRTTLSRNIYDALTRSLEGYPVTMTDMIVANVGWHPRIETAVLNKQEAKLKKEQEAYTLAQQNLTAQQAVNTAKAKAEAVTIEAKANAEAIRLKGDAEAAAIQAKADALRRNPSLIQLTHEERWNGRLPQFLMQGDKAPALLLQTPALPALSQGAPAEPK